MPDIDPKIMVHRLNIDPEHHPIKQKKRNFIPECQKAIANEVNKLILVKFNQEDIYSDQLANAVLIKKVNGKWQVCTDFTNLNKACSKDNYLLSQIDQLVDVTSGHELLTFMDAFFSYNEIWMALEDEKKQLLLLIEVCFVIGLLSLT